MSKLPIILIIVFLTLGLLIFFNQKNYQPVKIKYGVTFSAKYAKYLGLDFKKTYLQILDDLKIRNLRLTTYWNELEKEQGKFDSSETDFLLNEAEKRGAKVLLVVGARQPRWPECHYPNWAKALSVKDRQEKTLEFIKKVVEKYKENKSIWGYQVENEPFAFWFGENCDKPDSKFLKTEVDLVRSLDSKKPIIVTDSGELGYWVDAIKDADILGSSVYRKSYSNLLKTYISYPIPSYYYQFKAEFVKKLSKPQDKKVILTELQAEPWLSGQTSDENLPASQQKLFTVNDFKSNIEFAKQIGFEEDYLWGVEWWYFMAKNGYPEYLDYAKSLFQ
jgi:hypothetical protein